MAASIVWFAFGALTAALSLQLPLGSARTPGTGLFPLALGVGLMALAAGQALREYHARRAAPEPAAPAPGEAGARGRVARFLAAVVVATALLQPLGYVASSFLLMLSLLAVFGLRRRGMAVAIAAASAAASWIIFVRVLGIPMPAGWVF
jgi:putative tricarboxylic transport membrane protein